MKSICRECYYWKRKQTGSKYGKCEARPIWPVSTYARGQGHNRTMKEGEGWDCPTFKRKENLG